ncbi:hypothetical protein BX616_002158 [Lobosporangium transversale]|uniref:Uncharacterized protein n=1 Tax=Lobosporangium transversale TaxID=64571 RepID=A0A1Y2G751_9FUNG|nr:hypothetical protein BCR41DRAFT_375401 [Lobosporangium transversale]KAF9917017.1 hypothetical protein BX616_002158 [Lobosporangium transversale]ORY99699.1 hypothetical protein BCR41DRAFT_375401 [Lobosporangium transversale]|eukprot:XP_021875963.1 hypothetical protein BCR41DRAFT_375401 [Lobosporangium transversale]
MFPTTEWLSEALQTLNAYDNNVLVDFPEINYYMLPETLRMIFQVINNKKFGEDLQRMQKWVKNVVHSVNASFADRLYSILTVEDNIYEKTFHADYNVEANITLRSLMSLSGENWLDDEAIKAILTFFSRGYGNGGKYVFIPPSWRWGAAIASATKKHIASKKTEKVFAIVYIGVWFISTSRLTVSALETH